MYHASGGRVPFQPAVYELRQGNGVLCCEVRVEVAAVRDRAANVPPSSEELVKEVPVPDVYRFGICPESLHGNSLPGAIDRRRAVVGCSVRPLVVFG